MVHRWDGWVLTPRRLSLDPKSATAGPSHVWQANIKKACVEGLPENDLKQLAN